MKRKSMIPAILLISSIVVISPTWQQPANAAWLGTAGTYRFIGAGYGHGVGLSQYGSKGMAEAGYSYAQILQHYYQSTTLSTAAQPSLRIHIADVGYGPSNLSFYTSSNVVVTIEGSTISYQVNAPTSGNPAVFSADANYLYLSQGPNLIAQTAGTLVLHFDSELDSGVSSLIHLFPPGNRYAHGRLEITRQTSVSKMRAVMKDLPMEKYLYGLGEVPSSWPMETLKSQATAARTYAYEKVTRLGQNRSACSCGLYSSTADQNYVGYEKEAGSGFANWKSGVDSTAGQLVTYAGNAIQAYYSSSSGGFTENSENVFGSAQPYLKGVRDPWDEQTSPYRSWARAFSGTDLERWLNARSETAPGGLFGLEIRAPYGVSGRVSRKAFGGGIRILSNSGPAKDVDGETFRQVINAGLSADKRTSEQLLSTFFQLASEPYPHDFRGGVFVAGGTDMGQEIVATGADAGGGPEVVISDKMGARLTSFFAYDVGFNGGARVALCDLDGDGSAEIVTGAGPGGGPHVRVFSATGNLIRGFFAYDVGFSGGVYVACANLDNSAGDEIITGAGPGGGPHVRVFDKYGNLVRGFFPFDVGFTGGVRVAAGDLDGNSTAEIVAAAGPGGGPHVKVLNANGEQVNGGFFPYSISFGGGVYVATVRTSSGNFVVTGPGEGGGSTVRTVTIDGSHVWDLDVFGGNMSNGARVGSVNGVVVASTGPGGWPITRLVP
ncbi:MAG: SpoIID/LytB domain-containing protein [Actinomycetota bacterium]|nr:SpoIID/LytB domain-containing protein [Actinomycetota bacterium]